MRPIRFVGLAATIAFLSGCADDPPAPETSEFAATIQQVQIPDELSAAEATYEANCAECHGTRGLGTDQGPPLVHIIYEPSHHADMAFFMAADRGVRAHHWDFGDMPPLPNVSNEQVEQVVDYIRFLQRQVGIQ